MAHAEPASVRTPTKRPGRPGSNPTDIFGVRTHLVAKWALPLVTGLVYGFWAAANRRHGGEITGGNMLFGWLTALVFIALFIAVGLVAERLRREQHALLWGAFIGSAVGFLIYQSGRSLIQSAGIGLAVAAGVFLTCFYRYYTHEDGEGNRIA
ncbi:hypothetical protein [Streptomyces sp. CRN 30]|uniref:hypothetical protein n=1 Tax=Streptomyces sp. CRN 30 TaxID=3075613 RepID=UPI002A81A9FB|nr:hypothetical protein [Streptomyces sp. CRN 30]